MVCFLIWKLQVSGQRVSNVAAHQNHLYVPRALTAWLLDIGFRHQYLKKTFQLIPVCSQGQNYCSLRGLAISSVSFQTGLGERESTQHWGGRWLERWLLKPAIFLALLSLCVWNTRSLQVLQVPGGEGLENRRTWSLCPLTSEDYNQTSWLGPRTGARIKTQEPEKNQSHLSLMSSMTCSNQLFTKQNSKSWSQQVDLRLPFPTPRGHISFLIYCLGRSRERERKSERRVIYLKAYLTPKRPFKTEFWCIVFW